MAPDDTTKYRGSINRRKFLKVAGAGSTLTASGLAGCTGGGGDGGGDGGDGGGGGDGGDGGGDGGDGGGDGGDGGGDTGDTGPTVLEVWLSYYTEGANKKAYTDKLNKRMESEIGVKMNITGVPYVDAPQKFRAAQASGAIPHLVEVMTHPELMAGGGAQDITSLFEGSESAGIISEKVLNFHKTWGAQSTGESGNLVTWPLGLRPFFPAMRKDWVESAGLDVSVVDASAGSSSKGYYAGTGDPADDLQALFQAFKDSDKGQKEGNWPSSTGMKRSDEEYLAQYFPQFGGSLTGAVNKTGDAATINTPEAVAAINMQLDYIDKGYFNPNALNIGDEEATTQHWAGVHGDNHIQDSTDLWADYLQEKPDEMKNGQYRWDLPYNAKSKGGQVAGLMWLPCLMFTSGGDWNETTRQAAVKMMDFWVGNPTNALKNATTLGWVPLNPTAIEEESFFGKTKMHERFWRGAAKRTLNEAQPGSIPAVPKAGAITYDIPFKMHQRIMQQDMPVQEAADKAADEINSLLAEAGRR